MSAVIKAIRARSKVRPFGFQASAPEVGIESNPTESELFSALQSLKDARQQIAELEDKRVEARAEGYQEGYAAGHATGAGECSKAIELLQSGISAAHRELQDSLRSTERLAAMMAKTCLESIIGDSRLHSDLITCALGHQLKTLEAAAVLKVAVSAEDFEDSEALEALGQSLGASLSIDPGLGAGECRISLQLGSLEVGPATQWRRLSQLLDQQVGD